MIQMTKVMRDDSKRVVGGVRGARYGTKVWLGFLSKNCEHLGFTQGYLFAAWKSSFQPVDFLHSEIHNLLRLFLFGVLGAWETKLGNKMVTKWEWIVGHGVHIKHPASYRYLWFAFFTGSTRLGVMEIALLF